jgi:SAM-dependent methyltransferase
VFDHVVDEYDAARPSYPQGVFDLLEPLDGRVVVDGGAGTGIATRELLARGAAAVALDLSLVMLTRARARGHADRPLVSDAAVLPFASRTIDGVCFAQSWHWVDHVRAGPEIARVLRPGGWVAAWWSHARADGDRWFDETWEAIEAVTGARRAHRDIDWGATIAASGPFAVEARQTVAWTRQIPVTTWVTELRSHSGIAALPRAESERLLATIELLARARFTDGSMDIPYETWWWRATVSRGSTPVS